MVGEAAIDVNQRGLLCYRKGEHANVTPFTLEAPLMRLSVRSLRRVVKGDLPIEFVQQDLTSYGGLELVRRYLHRLDVMGRLRRAVADVPSDYGGARLALLVVALFYVGARRLEHLRYLAGDRLIARFCGVARFPTAHTVSNWLKQFTQATLAPLIQLNHDLVVEAVTKLVAGPRNHRCRIPSGGCEKGTCLTCCPSAVPSAHGQRDSAAQRSVEQCRWRIPPAPCQWRQSDRFRPSRSS